MFINKTESSLTNEAKIWERYSNKNHTRPPMSHPRAGAWIETSYSPSTWR